MNAAFNLPPGCPTSAISYDEPEADLAQQIAELQDRREALLTRYFNCKNSFFRKRAAWLLRLVREVNREIAKLEAEL